MSEQCVVPEQISKDVCAAIFSELYGFMFLDTTKVGFIRPEVSAVNTRAGIQALIDAETGLTLISRSTEKNDADATIAEIAGVQIFVKFGEIRAKMRIKANYVTWAKMADYNYFTGGEAYLLAKNNKISYINDSGNPALAFGLPLAMVQVDVPPLFSNGTDPAEFYMMVNIDANLLAGLERADLDFPIHTLNPVKAV